MDITQDHLFLVLGTSGYNGTQFNSFQNFTYPSNTFNYVFISDDHQYLAVSQKDAAKLYRYYFSGISQQFLII